MRDPLALSGEVQAAGSEVRTSMGRWRRLTMILPTRTRRRRQRSRRRRVLFVLPYLATIVDGIGHAAILGNPQGAYLSIELRT